MPKNKAPGLDAANHLRLKAELENLPGFLTFVSTRAQQLGLTEKRLLEVELVLEEVLVNIIKYAYSSGPSGWIDLNLSYKPSGSLQLEIRDQGEPFNLLERADPDLETRLMERPVGGLGIFFIKQLTDTISWRRENDENCLIITFAPGHV
jgi:anti-sigma regulatory factor (Ser/Thr protein kinase)